MPGIAHATEAQLAQTLPSVLCCCPAPGDDDIIAPAAQVPDGPKAPNNITTFPARLLLLNCLATLQQALSARPRISYYL